MNYEEALEWLSGERSMWNLFANGTPEAHVLTAQTDAAMTQRAYWIVKARREGMIDGEDT